VTWERPARRLATRPRIRNDDRIIVEPMRGRAAAFDLLDERVLAQWAELLRARSTSYLMVDCLRPILDALGLDEQRDAGRFLVPLDRLLRDASIPDGLVVHHIGHTGERSRGDSRIRDWPTSNGDSSAKPTTPAHPLHLRVRPRRRRAGKPARPVQSVSVDQGRASWSPSFTSAGVRPPRRRRTITQKSRSIDPRGEVRCSTAP
jgi:hypothetical protein